jgi:hypothetical protein
MRTKADIKCDPEDEAFFAKAGAWYFKSSKNWYAVVEKKLAHRTLMGAAPTEIVDHINGETLDNRKENLRIVNKAMNGANRVKHHERNTCGYRGVSFNKMTHKWEAYVTVNYERNNLGYYKDRMLAAAVAATWRGIYMPGARK